MNKFTIFIVTAMLLMAIVLAIFGGIWHSNASAYGAIEESDSRPISYAEAQDFRDYRFYIDFRYSSIAEGCLIFVRYFQLLSLFLPTSLFVTVEFLKVFIAYFMSMDVDLMSKEKGRGTSVQNMSIVEDLGMIHYVFSDKTGTLTKNQMDFHSMCVGE